MILPATAEDRSAIRAVVAGAFGQLDEAALLGDSAPLSGPSSMAPAPRPGALDRPARIT